MCPELWVHIIFGGSSTREGKSDISRIAKSSGFSENNIALIRDHIFIETHTFANGEIKKFYEDPLIAHAWQRLDNGKPTDLDILLLKHELLELTLIKTKGYNADRAHEEANRKFPWAYKVSVKVYHFPKTEGLDCLLKPCIYV